MKKSLIAFFVTAAAISAHANQGGQAQAEELFKQGNTLVVGTVMDGKLVPKEVFDGVRIVRLPNGNCQIENHRYTPNLNNPVDGKVAVSTALLGNCVLNQPAVSPMAAFK